jgi:hypothetical protein
MGRRKSLEDNTVVSARIEKSMYDVLHDIAALETINSGKVVTIQELIRNALDFVYSDNERLRECFRRTRAHLHNRSKKSH